MNEEYLRLSDEKNRIVQTDCQLIHGGVETISTMMVSLQEALQQRHKMIAANLDPIDSPRVMEAISKLKTALKGLHTRNATRN